MKLYKHKPDYAVPVGDIILEHVWCNESFGDVQTICGATRWLCRKVPELSESHVLPILLGNDRLWRGQANAIGEAIGLSPDILLKIDYWHWSCWHRLLRWCRRLKNRLIT